MGVLLTLLSTTIVAVVADCAFEQSTGQKHPFPLPPNSKPFVPPSTINSVCPQYSDLACCSQTQITLLSLNLFAINTFFNNILAGGCPACGQNLMRFWCLFTCSPLQSEFVSSLGVANVTAGGVTYTVLKTLATVNREYACALYDSCSSVSYVRELSAMNSCEGFFEYQGATEAIPAGTDISFNWVDNQNSSMQLPLFACNSFPTNFSNPLAGNTSCPCNTCSSMCSGSGSAGSSAPSLSPSVSLPTVLNGFPTVFVISCYAVVFLVSVAFHWKLFGLFNTAVSST
jgi:Niemann-Pick C1 protein